MGMKIFRQSRLSIQVSVKTIRLDASLNFPRLALETAMIIGPDTAKPFGCRRMAIVSDQRPFLLQRFKPSSLKLLCVFAREGVKPDQTLEIALVYGSLFLTRLVQPWLCERGLIAIVVAKAPITVQVDDGVLLEFSPEIQGESHYVGDGFGVITVHVKNGN